LSSSDSVFITGHKTGDIRVWSLSLMKQMHCLERVHQDKIESCKLTPNGRSIVSIGRDCLIKITDFYSYKTLATIEHPYLVVPSAGCTLDISSNGKYVAVGSSNGSILIFNLTTFELEEIY